MDGGVLEDVEGPLRRAAAGGGEGHVGDAQRDGAGFGQLQGGLGVDVPRVLKVDDGSFHFLSQLLDNRSLVRGRAHAVLYLLGPRARDVMVTVLSDRAGSPSLDVIKPRGNVKMEGKRSEPTSG